jgi:predicted CXXCH cytochrome family protein
MKKYAISILILAISFSLNQYNESIAATFYDAHSWPDSKCGLCHLSSTPNPGSASLIGADQSRLCESCHTGSVTVPSHSNSNMLPMILSNHPVKFSPFDFDPDRINQNVIQKGNSFYVSGPGGDVRLFGNTIDTAVTECSSCHDPHGKSGLPLLHYTSNLKDDLCLICHINMKNTM